jgi:4'-phosphopantetheinyl transferase
VRVPTDESCGVWWASPLDPDHAAQLRALLDAHELDRLDRFRRAPDRARYLAAHALTRLVLAPLVGQPPQELVFDRRCRCGEQHGKPTLPGGPQFSFTHGGELVGIAVRADGGPIGLDVEPVRELSDLDGMARHISSPIELGRPLPAAPDSFFTAWTRKEALLKATGEGIASPMAGITLGPDGVEQWIGEGAPTDEVWLCDLAPAPGYRAAVAGLGEPPDALVELDARPLLAANAGG